ncbi:MAG: hypothetical protein WC241_02280 [Candidatus Paceibacterota bacterium]|jgi:hypothetical protein
MELVGSEIFSKKDKNEIEVNTKTEIRNNFGKPFNEDNVLNNFNNPEKLNNKSDDYLIYHNALSNTGLEFNIYKVEAGFHRLNNKNEGRIIDFVILNSKEKKYLLGLRFMEENIDGEECLNLLHRRITSEAKDQVGISGLEFLQKTEDYLSILKKNDILKVDKIKAEVSQFSVLSWLMKGGFNFLEKNKKELSKYFKYENGVPVIDSNGRFILNDDSILLPFEDRKQGGDKDPYIVHKFFLTNPLYKELKDRYYKDGTGVNLGKKVLILDKKNIRDGAGDVVYNLIGAGVMPRFILEKEIK